ncbi:MAG: DeoR/GlpR family DNA-binding transcription regulator [Aggregatilineales bacterium]
MSKPARYAPIGEQRRREIAQMVRQKGTISTVELVDYFKLSPMTIWRDLRVLEDMGVIQRVRGGAASLDDTTGEPIYTHKKSINSRQKETIAHYAAINFVRDGQIIILEAGTTVMAMVKYLDRRDLTVISNGLGVLNELSTMLTTLTVISCGGVMRDVSKTFIGPQAEQFFETVQAHLLFLSATGITIEGGISDPSPLEIQVKRAMISSAERVVLLIDSSKFGIRSLKQVLPIEQVHAIVTDKEPPSEYIDWLARANVELHIAPPKRG